VQWFVNWSNGGDAEEVVQRLIKMGSVLVESMSAKYHSDLGAYWRMRYYCSGASYVPVHVQPWALEAASHGKRVLLVDRFIGGGLT
jgi:hypothetical protein